MPKIFLGIPSYGYKCFTPFVSSLLKLQKLVDHTENIDIHVHFIPQESLITRARNSLVSYFLKSDCTHLMFIDADIEFHAEDVLSLLNHDKDIIVGAYPHKSLVKKEGLSDQACFDYAVNMLKKDVRVENGVMEVQYGATGFMMIKRDVLEKMIAHYPETKYVNDIKLRDEFGEERYALFDCIIDPDSKRYLSEDYTFCKRWTDMGGKIHVDIMVNLSHFGIKSYDGSFLMKLKENGLVQAD